MRRVVIESPYGGDVARHEAYALDCLADCYARGEAPIASHLLGPRVLDDTDPAQRAQGMAAGWAWTPYADAVLCYVDHGVSDGMRQGIERAAAHRVPVDFRSLLPAR